jgi:hypothetical protein
MVVEQRSQLEEQERQITLQRSRVHHPPTYPSQVRYIAAAAT